MKYFMFAVAPRMGSVDRNKKTICLSNWFILSLPAWGAWIEIVRFAPKIQKKHRRSPHGEREIYTLSLHDALPTCCRSPHGERG